MPRTTRYNHKRLKTKCSVEGPESGTPSNNFDFSTAVGSDFHFSLSSSEAIAKATCDSSFTENLEQLEPICEQFFYQNYVDGSDDLDFRSSNDVMPGTSESFDSTDSVNKLDPNSEQFPSEGDRDVYVCDYSDSDTSNSDLELESDIDSDEVQSPSTSDEEEMSDNVHDSNDIRLFSDHEKVCMAVLAYVSRHCITSEAAKDLMDLVKVICPESATFKTLSYSKVQEVCGRCELRVYDICEKCHRLFPLDDENSYRCSTTGCGG